MPSGQFTPKQSHLRFFSCFYSLYFSSFSNISSCSIPVTSPVLPPTSFDSWNGFKLVGDNIDKNVRASYQRIGHTTQSLHYFHSYALLDRIDFSGLSDEPPPPSIVDPLTFLPLEEDISLVESDIVTLISRKVILYIIHIHILYIFLFMQDFGPTCCAI